MRTVIRTICVRQTKVTLLLGPRNMELVHQSRTKDTEFMHRVEANVTAAKEDSDEKPPHLAGGVCVSTQA